MYDIAILGGGPGGYPAAIRGAQLEAAFVAVRAQYPAARNVSDQELAAAILAP